MKAESCQSWYAEAQDELSESSHWEHIHGISHPQCQTVPIQHITLILYYNQLWFLENSKRKLGQKWKSIFRLKLKRKRKFVVILGR